MVKRLPCLLLLLLAVPACSELRHVGETAVKTPPPLVSIKGSGVASAFNASEASPVHIHLAHDALRADATYPVIDYNADTAMATRFRVTDNGKLVLDKLVDAMPVDLRMFTEDRHLVALLDTYTGGAHCCAGVALADPGVNDDASYAVQDFGDTGYSLQPSQDLTGFVFVTADDAMAYAFSSFAGSTFPIRMLAYRDGAFLDVTNTYPQLIAADAKLHWNEFLTDARNSAAPQSALVAYLADEYRLGKQKEAWSRVHTAYGDDADFTKKAQAWLKSNGYVASSQ